EAVVAAHLPVTYFVFDTAYTAGWFTKLLARLGLTWQGTLHPDTRVHWKGHSMPLWLLAGFAEPKWRKELGLCAIALQVYAPSYGQLQLVVTRNRHGNEEFLATNALPLDLTSIVLRKRS